MSLLFSPEVINKPKVCWQIARVLGMTHMQRRDVLQVSGGVLGTGFLAGCLGSDEPADEQQTEAAEDDETSETHAGFPQNDITMVVPYGSGGGYDTYTRIVAPYFEQYLPNDVTVVVQNIEGAGGQIATEQVYNAEPDGYTIEILNLDEFSRTQVLEDVDFDLREMTHYAQIAANVRSILVADHADIETWDDFVTKTKNDELRFGTAGPLSGGMTIPAVIGELSGLYPGQAVRDNLIIYDGTSEIQQGMLGGDVDVLGMSYSSGLPYIESEEINMFLVTTADEEPPKQTPDVLTLTTAGIDPDTATRIENALTAVRTFAGPPGVAEEPATVIRDTFKQAINDEEFIAQAEEAERPVKYGDADRAKQLAEDKIQTWTDLQGLFE